MIKQTKLMKKPLFRCGKTFFFFFPSIRKKRAKMIKQLKLVKKTTVSVWENFFFFLFGGSKYFSMQFPLLIEIVPVSSDALHLVQPRSVSRRASSSFSAYFPNAPSSSPMSSGEV